MIAISTLLMLAAVRKMYVGFVSAQPSARGSPPDCAARRNSSPMPLSSEPAADGHGDEADDAAARHVVGGLERARLAQLAADERRPVAVDRDGRERRDDRERLREREARGEVRARLGGTIDRALVLARARERVEALRERVLAADERRRAPSGSCRRSRTRRGPSGSGSSSASRPGARPRRRRSWPAPRKNCHQRLARDVLPPLGEPAVAADVADRDGRTG